jgi:putative heme-binding domain-containing protein
MKHLTDPDPFLRHAAVQRLARSPELLAKFDPKALNSQQRLGLLLAWRASGAKDGTKTLPEFLKDPDPDVRFLAVKWVRDEKLTAFRPQIAEMLKSTTLDPRSFVALATALARLDNKPVNDDNLAAYFLDRLNDSKAPLSARLMALQAIPAAYKPLRTERLVELLNQDSPVFRIEVLRALKDRADAKAAPAVRAIAQDKKEAGSVRAQAILTLSALNADVEFLLELAGEAETAVKDEAMRALTGAKLAPKQETALLLAVTGQDGSGALAARVLGKPTGAGRPTTKDTDAWLKRLDGKADPDAGRRVFESPKLAGCYKCHRVEGRGADIGPDLSLIGRTERKWIVESILQPSAVVAPHYQAWKIELTDGRTLTGLLVGTHLDKSVYIDEKGNRFEVLATEVADIRAAKNSIMPDGLLDGLTDQEIKDLIAYLAARK